jgi:hypothetical protein
MLFNEIREPRCLLFGMKLTKSEAEWLRRTAQQQGLSRSSLVRRLLADVANKEDIHAGQERR